MARTLSTRLAIGLLFCALLPQADSRRIVHRAVAKNAKKDSESTTENAVVARPGTPASKSTGLMDWVLNDMISIDKVHAEEKLRRTAPDILKSNEQVEMAFKVGKDKVYFTTKRILLRPKGWLISRSTKYESIPYESIITYGMQTAGMFPDMDTDVWFWTKMPKLSYFQLEFNRNNVDIFQLLNFINSKILGGGGESSLLQTDADWWPTDLWHWLGDNAREVNAEKVEQLFKHKFPVLQSDETVEKAFKSGRDSTLLTNKRLLKIDVTGITGYAVQYESYPWSCVAAFAVQNTGTIDDDAEMIIWTSIPDSSQFKFEQDLRGFGKGSPDVAEIQAIFNKYILPADATSLFPPSEIPVLPAVSNRGTISEIIGYLGGDHAQLDAGEAEARVRRQSPWLLNDNEHIEMAFQKSRFLPDMIYMTTMRLLYVDIMEGGLDTLIQDKIQYRSIPYSSMLAFEAETASQLDFDSHVSIYTSIHPPPPWRHCETVADHKDKEDKDKDQQISANGAPASNSGRPQGNYRQQRSTSYLEEDAGRPQGNHRQQRSGSVSRSTSSTSSTSISIKSGGDENNGPKEVCTMVREPGMSKVDVEFRANTNLFDIQKLLHGRIVKVPGGQIPRTVQSDAEGPSLFFSPVNIFHWLDGNAKEISTDIAVNEVSKSGPFLQDGETVIKAFTTWRDMTMLTSDRVLSVDIQSYSALRKAVFRTIPYSSIHAFGVQTGGTFDFDAEIMLYTNMPWLPKVQQDLRRGTSNIAEIQGLLCNRVVGAAESALVQTGTEDQFNPVGNFLDWLDSNTYKIDKAEAQAQLNTQPPVLQDGEKIKAAYRVSKDLTVFTNKRLLIVDQSGFDRILTKIVGGQDRSDGTSVKVEYRTVPYSSIAGFSVETAAHYFDRDEEIVMHTDMYELGRIEQDIAVGQGDIFEVQKLLTKKVL